MPLLPHLRPKEVERQRRWTAGPGCSVGKRWEALLVAAAAHEGIAEAGVSADRAGRRER